MRKTIVKKNGANEFVAARADPVAAGPCAVPMVEAMTALVVVDHALRQWAQCG